MPNSKELQRYFFKVIYRGNSYEGWQTQSHGHTIQDELEKALATIYEPIRIVGSGRTDAGVHALGQVAHLDGNPDWDLPRFLRQFNALLPADIYVEDIYAVQADAHARFDATSRSYTYHLMQIYSPFAELTAYHYPYHLDIHRMNGVAALLVGRRDYRSFCKGKSYHANAICDIKEAFWQVEGSQIKFCITANRFLRHMVRTIVGTLLKIEQHRGGGEQLQAIIDRQNRCVAGYNVPAKGLFLTRVTYPEAIYKVIL